MRSTNSKHGVRLVVVTFLAASFTSFHAVRSGAQVPGLGKNASLHGKQIFPSDNPWNTDISTMPVDANSANLIASMGLGSPLHPDFGTTWQNAPIGFDYVVVRGSQALKPITFTIADESDPGPY